MKTYILRYTYHTDYKRIGRELYENGGQCICREEHFLSKFNARLHAWMYKRQYNATCKIYEYSGL